MLRQALILTPSIVVTKSAPKYLAGVKLPPRRGPASTRSTAAIDDLTVSSYPSGVVIVIVASSPRALVTRPHNSIRPLARTSAEGPLRRRSARDWRKRFTGFKPSSGRNGLASRRFRTPRGETEL